MADGDAPVPPQLKAAFLAVFPLKHPYGVGISLEELPCKQGRGEVP